MRLAEFQHGLQSAILGSVLAASDRELGIKTGPEACPRDDHGCSRYRIAIHHDHFWTRMHDFAAYRYPLLQRALGDAAFTQLVRAYIAAHPPTSFTIGVVVEALPVFLADRMPWASSPILAHLAAFDFHRSGVRLTAEEATVSAAELAALGVEALARTRLRLKRRTMLATTRYRFEPKRIHELPRDAALDDEPTHWLVYIARGACITKPVSPRVYAALQRLTAAVAVRELFADLRGLGFTAAECDAVVDRLLDQELLVALPDRGEP
jgi:hypothetical protein